MFDQRVHSLFFHFLADLLDIDSTNSRKNRILTLKGYLAKDLFSVINRRVLSMFSHRINITPIFRTAIDAIITTVRWK